MNRQTRLVYVVLLAVWAMMIVWQVVEHNHAKHAAKAVLVNRSKDISTTVALVLASTPRPVITQERLESALNALVTPQELKAVAMLNVEGKVVASAGPGIDAELGRLRGSTEHWGTETVALMNPVALGTNIASETDTRIVMPRKELHDTNRPSFRPPPPGPGSDRPTRQQSAPGTNDLAASSPASGETNSTPIDRPLPEPRGEPGRRPQLRRPWWMSQQEWDSIIAKKGAHSLVIVMSTHSMREATQHDLWLRLIISSLASISVVGLGLAWSNLVKSSELEVRLVRAAELNTRLREMSLAAAGLAHETKNPLNIIRGLAQMISKQEDASPAIRQKTREIVDEADRVTGQVNEFINFSRPRQLKPAPVALSSAVAEVARALGPDLEDKAIRLQVQNDLPVIEADEQQLRQALFNLIINAIQAVEKNGEIQVAGGKRTSNSAVLEIRDNGPGVPPEHRSDVFKPYFTTNQKGTGLGLAVVQQIVLGHGWEIECLGNEPRGAVFRISHLRLAGAA